MKTINTNWGSPKTNFFAGMLDLRKALAAGMNAVLVKARNEDCEYPIKIKQHDLDFRNYKITTSTLRTRQEIVDNQHMSEFQKHLALNYKTCYGSQEAVNRYYETGFLSKDNIKGQGVSHLIKVEDLVPFLTCTGQPERALSLKQQYLTLETADESHFYDNYVLNVSNEHIVKKFRRKLWVVQILDKDSSKAKIPVLIQILNIILYPTKFIPTKDVLKMPNYKVITYRIGSVSNGISIEFNIPKKFGFK